MAIHIFPIIEREHILGQDKTSMDFKDENTVTALSDHSALHIEIDQTKLICLICIT